MVDILAQLPLLSWRALPPPPYDLVGFSWENRLAPREVPYVDVDVHDDVGRKSGEFKVRLMFLETAQPGAFTVLWPQWLAAIKTGDADYLVHPLLGTLRARVQKVGGELVAKTRDGVIVEVTFVETNEDPSVVSADLSSDIQIVSMTQLADSNAAAVGISFPSGASSTSIFQAFEQIRGSIFSFSLTVTGSIDALMGNVETMMDEVTALDDHSTWAAYDSLVNVWMGLDAMKKQLQSAARKTATKKTTNDTTLDKFASEVGNTAVDVMGLNIAALRFPLVPKGTTLTYYTSK